MGDWRDFPLPDGSYSDATRPWSQQDACNYIPTFAEGEGTRSRLKLATAPGLETFSSVGDGPHRGERNVEGRMFVVSGTELYQVATNGAATLLGTIPGTGRVSMTHNQIAGGNELVIGTVDNSYVWNTVTSTLTATGVALQSVDFLNQLVIGIEPQRRFFRYSALADATSWNTLDNESAESSPDRLVGGIVSQGEYLAFGERSIEVWRNDPTAGSAFQRGPVIERGCANANTLCRLDNSVFFVDNFGIPCRLDGYTPVPIAPKAIIEEISNSDPTKLFAFTYEDNGYVVYYLTAQDGKTWGYDVTTRRWHRRESYGMDRWRLNTLFKWNGDWYGGDGFNGKIYRLRWGFVYEGCEIMPRTWRSGVMHGDGNRVSIPAFRLFANTGLPDAYPPLQTITPAAEGEWLMIGNITDEPSGGFLYSIDGDDWSGSPYEAPTVDPFRPSGGGKIYRHGNELLAVGTAVPPGTYRRLAYNPDKANGSSGWISYDYATSVSGAHAGYLSGSWYVSGGGSDVTKITGGVMTTITGFTCNALDSDGEFLWVDGSGGNLRKCNAAGTEIESLAPSSPATVAVGSVRCGGGDVVYTGMVHNGVDYDVWARKYNGPAATLAAVTLPFSTYASATRPIVHYSAGLGLWIFAVGTAVAYGPTLDSIELSGGTLAFDCLGIGDDGRKVIFVGITDSSSTLDLETFTPITGIAGAPQDVVALTDYTPETASVGCVSYMEGSRVMQLRYTNDGGNNYSDWRNLDCGESGSHQKPLIVRRLGRCYDRIWEAMDTSPIPQDVFAASVMVEAE